MWDVLDGEFLTNHFFRSLVLGQGIHENFYILFYNFQLTIPYAMKKKYTGYIDFL
jgi:hypothetical protein